MKTKHIHRVINIRKMDDITLNFSLSTMLSEVKCEVLSFNGGDLEDYMLHTKWKIGCKAFEDVVKTNRDISLNLPLNCGILNGLKFEVRDEYSLFDPYDISLIYSHPYTSYTVGQNCVYDGKLWRKVDCSGKEYDKVKPGIKRVMFNDPATIVFWEDGSKTVVKCSPRDIYDAEKGLAMAITKKYFGNDNSFHDIFKEHVPEKPYCGICKYLHKSVFSSECFTCDSNFSNFVHKDEGGL